MGQTEKAVRAEQEREILIAAARTGGGAAADKSDLGSRPMLNWVDPDTFAASGTPYGLDGPAMNQTTQKESFGKRLVAKLIPWPKGNKPEQTEDQPRLSQRTDSSHGGGTDGRLLLK